LISNKYLPILQEEGKKLLLFFVALLIVYLIAYSTQDIWTVIRVVASLFWFLVLPGFVTISFWREQFSFIERLIIGIVLSMAIAGVFSYFLNLLNLHVRWYGWIIPTVVLFVDGIIVYFRKEK